jgi:S-formylglutathione hydrolase FrmB
MRRLFFMVVALLLLAGRAAADNGSTTHETERMSSAALGRDLVFSIYLPPGWAEGGRRYPVAYLLHGVDGNHLEYLHDGRLQAALDGLIASGKAPPMIVVMPDGGNSWYVDSGDLGGPGNYGTAIGDELPAYVERVFRGIAEPGGRAIGGFSMGGFGALHLAFERPFRYAAAASLSGAFWTRIKPDTVMENWTRRIFSGSFGQPFQPARFIRQNPFWTVESLAGAEHAPAVYLAVGAADPFRAELSTRDLEGRIAKSGLRHTLEIFPGGHDWSTWGAALPGMLQFFGTAFKAPD